MTTDKRFIRQGGGMKQIWLVYDHTGENRALGIGRTTDEAHIDYINKSGVRYGKAEKDNNG